MLVTDRRYVQNVCLLVTQNLLHNVEDESDRDISITGAREIAAIIKLWIRQIRIEELKDARNVKYTSRNQNGLGGPYVFTPWFWVAERLIRGNKILRALGRKEGELARRRVCVKKCPRLIVIRRSSRMCRGRRGGDYGSQEFWSTNPVSVSHSLPLSCLCRRP